MALAVMPYRCREKMTGKTEKKAESIKETEEKKEAFRIRQAEERAEEEIAQKQRATAVREEVARRTEQKKVMRAPKKQEVDSRQHQPQQEGLQRLEQRQQQKQLHQQRQQQQRQQRRQQQQTARTTSSRTATREQLLSKLAPQFLARILREEDGDILAMIDRFCLRGMETDYAKLRAATIRQGGMSRAERSYQVFKAYHVRSSPHSSCTLMESPATVYRPAVDDADCLEEMSRQLSILYLDHRRHAVESRDPDVGRYRGCAPTSDRARAATAMIKRGEEERRMRELKRRRKEEEEDEDDVGEEFGCLDALISCMFSCC